jgi:hypothetical protein
MAQILKKVNDAIAPDEMSASEALEFVRDLIGNYVFYSLTHKISSTFLLTLVR